MCVSPHHPCLSPLLRDSGTHDCVKIHCNSLHALTTLGHNAFESVALCDGLVLSKASVRSSGPSSESSRVGTTPTPAQAGTPFTQYVLSRIPDEELQKLFALSFGEHRRHDADALAIDLDHVYKWLGYNRKDNAARLLKMEIPDGEYALLTSEEGRGPANRASYMISFDQFEELMIAAQTAQGKKARKFVLLLKKILQEYPIAEQKAHTQQMVEAARANEAARGNALQQQLHGLRAQQQHLYCFRLFGNRYKIGIAKDVDRRIRQHTTSCPSGRLMYSVPIACKAMEKVLESIMRSHGAWIKWEEYELPLSDEQIKAVFDVITRVEELLNVTPLEEYHTLLSLLDQRLRSDVRTHVVPHSGPNTPAEFRSRRPVVSPQKEIVDARLIDMLNHETLPAGKIQSEQLRSRLLTYARSASAASNTPCLTFSSSEMKEVSCSILWSGDPKAQTELCYKTFDFDALRRTLSTS